MGSSNQNQDEMITNINVTPLVDVVLVLLIIFMATAPLINRRSLKVNVPKSAHSEKKATSTLQLFLTLDREFYLDETKMVLDEIIQTLKRKIQLNPVLHVSVAADQGIPYGEVIGLLDAVRGAGVKKVALEVKSQ